MAIFPWVCPSKIKMILCIRFTHRHILGEKCRTDSRADPSKDILGFYISQNIRKVAQNKIIPLLSVMQILIYQRFGGQSFPI